MLRQARPPLIAVVRLRKCNEWVLPKGKLDDGETPREAAVREVWEETGWQANGDFLPLGHVRQRGGKEVHAWAVAADLDPRELRSNGFTLEWPPHSGQKVEFPEIDRADYFELDEARRKLIGVQTYFLDELERLIASGAWSPR